MQTMEDISDEISEQDPDQDPDPVQDSGMEMMNVAEEAEEKTWRMKEEKNLVLLKIMFVKKKELSDMVNWVIFSLFYKSAAEMHGLV